MDLIETPRVENVKYCEVVYEEDKNQKSNQFNDGRLCLTCHHLIFSFNDQKSKEIWILYSSIDSIEPKVKETKYQLLIKSKDFKITIIEFSNLNNLQSVQRSLEALSNISLFMLFVIA